MCGIVASLSCHGSVSDDSLRAGMASLHHRGPDGRGLWVSPDRRVGLGHTRLSIIDLSTGSQPIANEDESSWIVANGEFYDFEEIRADLVRRGHRFRTRSDSEIALHLYEDFGPECLHHLRGEFAFVIWDARHRRLFAGRDRFGVKPLFYAQHGDTLHLASEAKALFAMGVPAQWSGESVYAGGFMLPGERTLFRGVHTVPPGHFLRATAEGHREHQYWDVHYPVDASITETRSDDEWIGGFRDVLENAVKTRLRADVPVGCYLSGGIDSCAVLGLASRHVSTPVQAFTLTFDGAQYDESAIAEEMATRVGAIYHPVPVSQAALADNFRDSVIQAELPCLNAHTVAKFMLSAAVRDSGYKVVLTGEGSDEILAGYPHFRRDMVLYHTAGQDPDETARVMAQLEAANQVSRGILLPDGATDSGDVCQQVLGFVPSWVDTQTGLALKVRQLMSDEFLADHGGVDAVANLLASIDVRGKLQGRNAVHGALYLWAKTALPHYILSNLGDRMEMAHSVEGRVAFMDHHVAEYLHHVPVSLKIRGMTEKYILREAVKDVITDTVYRRQKHPFLSPPATLNPEQRLHTLMQDTLRSTAVDNVPFLDRAKVVARLDQAADDGQDFGARVVTDQVLTIAMSYVFMHEGLGVAS